MSAIDGAANDRLLAWSLPLVDTLVRSDVTNSLGVDLRSQLTDKIKCLKRWLAVKVKQLKRVSVLWFKNYGKSHQFCYFLFGRVHIYTFRLEIFR